MKDFVVAVVGASGAVGEEIISLLEDVDFGIKELVPLASSRSVGKSVTFRGKKINILETTHDIFAKLNIDIAFFSAGGNISSEFAPSATKAGALVIDNTSFFRMQDDVPLVVPEVNPDDIGLWKNTGIIANPNCSTIQMVQVLAPLHKKFDIQRVDVSTYQAVSGAGKKGMESLLSQTAREINNSNNEVLSSFSHKIAFNLIPHIDVFLDNGYTKEEIKMIKETSKIMHSNFQVSATCVRVPILRSHSESISIRFNSKVTAKEAREVLESAENIIVIDDISKNEYPMPLIATNTDNTYVGRIREDYFDKNTIHLFCVADQIRVGAATNAIRIAQKWVKMREA